MPKTFETLVSFLSLAGCEGSTLGIDSELNSHDLTLNPALAKTAAVSLAKSSAALRSLTESTISST